MTLPRPNLEQPDLACPRGELRRLGYSCCLLLDPIKIRYASDTRSMSLWTQHSPERYLFVAVEGPVVLFDNCDFKSSAPRPGMTFRDFARAAWPVPDAYRPNSYCSVHGVGLTDEWPDLCNPHDFEATGYDGVLAETMTLCVESYMGLSGGSQGIKLKQQVLLTAQSAVALCTLPSDPVPAG